jgi:carboxyl-terminal processing protease
MTPDFDRPRRHRTAQDESSVRSMPRLKTGLAALALIGCGAVGTLILAPLAVSADTKSNRTTYEQLDLFGTVFERVRDSYVEAVPDDRLIETALRGMLTSLDPHSDYMNEKSFAVMQEQTSGEYGGIGLEVTMTNGVVKVVSPIDDTPAATAGIKSGDIITAINGESLQGVTMNDAVDRMKGPLNSPVKLTIQRDGQEPLELSVNRAVIQVDPVKSRLIGGDIGYLRISIFNEHAADGVSAAMAKLRSEAGDRLRGVVLDLRNNPGGLLDQAIAISDDFLDRGEIVSTRGRLADDQKRFNATQGDLAQGLPMVVLINGGSASASEIVTGALQDQRRAIVIGTRSFGKGSVQTIIPLPGHGALRLTTARYFTPSGRSIQAEGIAPDIEVPAARLEVIDEKFRHEADLRGALVNPNTPSGKPATASNTAPGAADDYQLSRAVDLLHGIALYAAPDKK